MFADYEYEAVSGGVSATVIHFYHVRVAHFGCHDATVGDFWNNHLAVGKNIGLRWLKTVLISFLLDLELGAIFQAWNCSVLFYSFETTLHFTFNCVEVII